MEDIPNLAKEPFEDNEESESKVDHYHAHTKECEDCGHMLEKHSYPREDDEKGMENEGEHGYPKEDNAEEKGDHEGKYPGIIRKMR